MASYLCILKVSHSSWNLGKAKNRDVKVHTPFIKPPGVSTSHDPTQTLVGEGKKIQTLEWPLLCHLTLQTVELEARLGCNAYLPRQSSKSKNNFGENRELSLTPSLSQVNPLARKVIKSYLGSIASDSSIFL